MIQGVERWPPERESGEGRRGSFLLPLPFPAAHRLRLNKNRFVSKPAKRNKNNYKKKNYSFCRGPKGYLICTCDSVQKKIPLTEVKWLNDLTISLLLSLLLLFIIDFSKRILDYPHIYYLFRFTYKTFWH